MKSHHIHHQHLHTLRFHDVSSSSRSPCKSIHVSSARVPKLVSLIFRSSRFIKPPDFRFSTNLNKKFLLFHNTQNPFRNSCKFSDNNDSDMTSQLELGNPGMKPKPEKCVNGIFWIILLNLGIYAADHVFKVESIKSLYLYHNVPAWYQFVTSTFCHYNWEHLSSNLFLLYIFGKLVEEEEGNFALWLSYIVTGAGANLVSWWLHPRNVVSVRSSGAVFGLFAISVIVKKSWDWRKILEVLILGQFVLEKVIEAARGSSQLAGNFRGVNSSLSFVNHLAHLSGALIGFVLIRLLSWVPSRSDDHTSETQGT